MTTYASPILEDLRAMGVMFATPPLGNVNMAGIVFDVSGEPTQIQNPAGVLKDFPGGGGGGGIPIPANNDGVDVVITSGPGGQINITADLDDDGGVSDVTVSAVAATATGLPGANINVFGGAATEGNGGAVTLRAGNDFTSGASGALITLNGATGGNGGELLLQVGAGATAGHLSLGARSGNLAVNADSDPVTIADLAPTAGAVSISKWIPVTVDGVAGFLPFFTLD